MEIGSVSISQGGDTAGILLKDIFDKLEHRKGRLFDSVMHRMYGNWRGYAVSLIASLVALGARLFLARAIGENAAFLMSVPAVLVSAIVGGMGPALTATALTILFTVITGDAGAAFPSVLGVVVVYGLIGGMIAWMGRILHGVRREAVEIGEKLDSRENQIRSIFQTIPDSAIVIDAQGLIISFNASAEAQFGYNEAEVRGQNVSMLMPQPYRDEHDGYIHNHLTTGERRIIGKGRVVAAQRKDGSTFPIMLTVGKVQSGDTTFFTGFIHDLTERTDSAAQLEQLHGELARLSRLNELGEMASTLAHELNQPLSAIANFLHGSIRLLKDADTEPATTVRHALDEAAKQSLRAGKIIHHLRESATHGYTEMKQESLRSVLEEAAALALTGSREAGVKARFNYMAAEDLVFVDRVQIQQVVINLMRNAVEAMRESPLRQLTLSTVSAGEQTIAVEIADTGPGVSDDFALQVFEPFVSTKPGGMGIGLAISKRIIEAHDGEISVVRNDDGGATFRFSLPLMDESEAA